MCIKNKLVRRFLKILDSQQVDTGERNFNEKYKNKLKQRQQISCTVGSQAILNSYRISENKI